MTNLEIALEECLARMDADGASVEEVLADYPRLQAELRPLLGAAQRLRAVASIGPSPEFKKRNRLALSATVRAFPRRRRANWRSPFALRTAGSLAVLALALISATTVSAQRALPGDTLYYWKLGSEGLWRTWQADRIEADLFLSNRRIEELQAVSGHSQQEQIVVDAYARTLEQLALDLVQIDEQKKIKVQAVLITHKELLITLVPEATAVASNLDKLLSLLPNLDLTPNAQPTQTPTPDPLGEDAGSGSLVLPAVPFLAAGRTQGNSKDTEAGSGHANDQRDSWFKQIIAILLGKP